MTRQGCPHRESGPEQAYKDRVRGRRHARAWLAAPRPWHRAACNVTQRITRNNRRVWY